MCGYINEHSAGEVVSIQHFVNAVNFGAELLSSLGHIKWKHVYQAPVYIPKKTEAYARQSKLDFEDNWGDSYSTRDYQDYYGSRYKSKDSYAGTGRLFREKTSTPITEEDISHFPEEDRETLRKLFEVKSPYEEQVESSYDEVASELPSELTSEIDEWYLENYPQYQDEIHRKELKHLTSESAYGIRVDISKLTQSQIDDDLLEEVCPNCYGIIENDNILLLNSYCTDCGSIFNIPPDEYKDLVKSRGLA